MTSRIAAAALAVMLLAAPGLADAQAPDYRLERSVELASGWRIETHRLFVASVPVRGEVKRVRRSPGGVVEIFGAARSYPARPRPTMITADEAVERAMTHAGAAVGRARRIAFVRGGEIRLGWEVTVGDGPTRRMQVLVDGSDGSVVLAHSLAAPALGRVYDPDPVTAMGRTLDVELEDLSSADTLTGTLVRAASCDATVATSCELRQSAAPDADGSFLYDPVEPSFDDPFAEVNAYFHAERAARYFLDVHGLDWDCCGSASPLTVVANYSPAPPEPFGYSLYDPSDCDARRCGILYLGQGAELDQSYDGDVVYHELTHAIVDERWSHLGFRTDEMGLAYDPGAIAEGTADYFAAVVSGDPLVGEYLEGLGIRPAEGALRRLDEVRRCPEDLFGELHEDGVLWGGALWSIREAITPDAADELALVTILSLGEAPTLADAAALLASTAQTMVAEGRLTEAEREAVEATLAARGLVGCTRVVPLDDGIEREGFSGTYYPTASFGSVAPIHYSVSVPEDAERLRIVLARVSETGAFRLLVRRGEPVGVGPDGEITADAELVVPEGGLVLEASTDPPLPNGDVLHLAVVTDDLDTASGVYGISATFEGGGGGGGCTCRATGARTGSFEALFTLAVLVGVRTRRRRL